MSAPWQDRRVIGDCTLYLGDCLEILPDLWKVDAVVTDPVWPNVPEEIRVTHDWREPWGLWRMAVGLLPSWRRLVVVMRCDSDPRFLAEIARHHPFLRTINLPYVMPGYLGRILGGDETAYWFGAPIARVPGRHVIPGRAPAAQPNDRPANGHPMSRAQVHFDWLLYWCSDPGESVLDPFMGSGTTGVACAKLGRPFVGIEIKPEYFALACERIERAYDQADLFAEQPAVARVDGSEAAP